MLNVIKMKSVENEIPEPKLEQAKSVIISSLTNRRIFDPPLSTQRYQWVQSFIEVEPNIKSVTDFGCGNGRLLMWLKTIPHLELINLIDIDRPLLEQELEYNFTPSFSDMLLGRQTHCEKPLEIRVYNGDLTIPDNKLVADCFVMIEVIEHMQPHLVDQATETIFGHYKPNLVVITTPNSDFNHLLRQEGEPAGKFRHFDHKFEWTRAQFLEWARKVCDVYPDYSFQLDGVGHLPNSEPFGPCTQIAVFRSRTKQTLQYEMNLDQSQRKIVDFMTGYKIPASKFNTKSDSTLDCDWSW